MVGKDKKCFHGYNLKGSKPVSNDHVNGYYVRKKNDGGSQKRNNGGNSNSNLPWCKMCFRFVKFTVVLLSFGNVEPFRGHSKL